jgi:hypothetical protein
MPQGPTHGEEDSEERGGEEDLAVAVWKVLHGLERQRKRHGPAQTYKKGWHKRVKICSVDGC